jgi:hypothetical protein
VSARWRKQREHDRHEHQRAPLERLDEDAADRGGGKAAAAGPRPRGLAVVQDHFVNVAHRRFLRSALLRRALICTPPLIERITRIRIFGKNLREARAKSLDSLWFSPRPPSARRAVGDTAMAPARIGRRRLVSTVVLLE